MRLKLRCQAFQNLLAELLRFAEEFLVFDKDPVQFQRLVGAQFAAQQHVAYVDGVGQSGFFGQFFKSSRGIVVVHALHSIATRGISQPAEMLG